MKMITIDGRSVLELLFEDDVHFVEKIPMQPVGNTAFILRQRNADMLTDGWKWQPRGSSRLPKKHPLYRRSFYFYQSQDGIERQFKRTVFERLDEGGRVIIQYIGQPKCIVPAPHGNSLKNHPFVRTNPSVLQKIKEALNASGGVGPSKLYEEAVRVTDVEDDDDTRAIPRNVKQVCNAARVARALRRATATRDGVATVSQRLLESDVESTEEVSAMGDGAVSSEDRASDRLNVTTHATDTQPSRLPGTPRFASFTSRKRKWDTEAWDADTVAKRCLSAIQQYYESKTRLSNGKDFAAKDDEDALFGNLIASELRKIESVTVKASLKKTITNAVYDAQAADATATAAQQMVFMFADADGSFVETKIASQPTISS